MFRRFVPLTMLWLAASPVFAQAGAPPPADPTQAEAPAPAPRHATALVSLHTNEGAIVLELEAERAPVTTANFLRYVDEKRLAGVSIYRATNVAANFGQIGRAHV